MFVRELNFATQGGTNERLGREDKMQSGCSLGKAHTRVLVLSDREFGPGQISCDINMERVNMGSRGTDKRRITVESRLENRMATKQTTKQEKRPGIVGKATLAS